MKTIYMVGRLTGSLSLQVSPVDFVEMPISWFEGMIGAFPVFTKKEDAEAYLDDCGRDQDYPIIEYEVTELVV